MTLIDIAGVFGVVLILVAYTGAAMGRLDPKQAPALVLNLVGALLVLWSLSVDFNLSAVLMESVWAVVAVVGLARLVIARNR